MLKRYADLYETKRRCSSSISYQGKKLPVTTPSTPVQAMEPWFLGTPAVPAAELLLEATQKRTQNGAHTTPQPGLFFCSFSLSFLEK